MGKSSEKKRRRRQKKRLERQRLEFESKHSRPETLLHQKNTLETTKNSSLHPHKDQSHHGLEMKNGGHAKNDHNEKKVIPDNQPGKPSKENLSQKIVGTESRKRSRRHLELVYPRENGNIRPFVFAKRQEVTDHTDCSSTDKSSNNIGETSNAQKKPTLSQSLDEILNSSHRKNLKKANEVKTKQSSESSCVEELEYKPRASIETEQQSEGKLSGMSVEEVVRDKPGCRPRANSTDGELGLPRRGLCDEHMVLQAHKWDLSIGSKPFRFSPKGFMNLGNTCFLNSTLQCLAYLPPFYQSLIAMPEHSTNTNGKNLSQGKRFTLVLRSLFHKVHGRDGGNHDRAIAPRSIVKMVPSLGTCGSRNGYKFRPGRQEDAHEFLLHLLDGMHIGELREAGIDQRISGWRDRLPIPRLDETTFIHRIFGGYLRSQVKCTKCGYCSNTYDPFLDLALEVSRKSITSVAAAFQEFTRKETLDSENRWKCSGCKKRVCATKQLTVFRPPLSLCVQLKRFTFGGMMGGFNFNSGGFYSKNFGGGGRGNKITKPIAFPAEMKLPLSDGRSCEYALTGTVIHVGGSSDSGHYTAYVKKPGKAGSDQWYHIDDSFVDAVSEKTVLRQKDAYLLFYCRKEVKLEFPSPPRRTSMTAEEATQRGRARARARADSLTKTELQPFAKETEKLEKHTTMHFTPPVELKKNEVKLKCDDANKDSEKDVKTGASHISQKGGESKDPSKINSTLSQKQKQIGSSSESSSDSSSDDSSETSSDESDTKESKQQHVPQGSVVEQNGKRSVTSDHSPTSIKTPPNQGERPSAPTCDNNSRSSRSSPELSSPSASDAVPPNSSSEKNDVVSPGLKKKKAATKTRVVLDRGKGREKVSVMIGPKYKNKKSWKPQTTGTTKLGQDYELLGNRVVDKWDDEAETSQSTDPSHTSQARSKIVNTMEKTNRVLKRKAHLDRWDAALDRGRPKKIKQKHIHEQNSGNSFQRILSGLQKMQPGRPKGFTGKAKKGNKHKRKRQH